MKKVKYLLLVLVFTSVFISCSKDEEVRHIKSIEMDKFSLELVLGKSYTITVNHVPSDLTRPVYTWESSNKEVAIVDDFGKISSVSEGQAYIIVKDEKDNLSCKCEVRVKPIVIKEIKLNSSSVNLEIGEQTYLTARIIPTNATHKELIWSSSNKDVASVDNLGNVITKSIGEAVISVSSVDNIKSKCIINVIPVYVNNSSFALD